MLGPWGKIVLCGLIAATAAAFFVPIVRRVRIVLAGAPEDRFRDLWRRFGYAVVKVLLQRCTLRDERLFTGLMHVGIFYGALAFDTMTVSHTLEGFFDGFYLFGRSGFGLLFSFIIDIAAFTVMAGVLFLAFRRFVLRPKAYATTPGDSARIYLLITLATATYPLFRGLRRRRPSRNGALVVPRAVARRHDRAVGDGPRGDRLALPPRLVGPPRRRLRLHRLRPPLQVPPHVRRAGQRFLPPRDTERRATGPRPREVRGLRGREAPRFHLEGRPRRLRLHGVRPLPGCLPGLRQRQAALAQDDHVQHGEGPPRRRPGALSGRSGTTSPGSSRPPSPRARSGRARPAAPASRNARSRSSTSARSSGPAAARS